MTRHYCQNIARIVCKTILPEYCQNIARLTHVARLLESPNHQCMTGNDEDWETSASDVDEIDCTPSAVASKSCAGSTKPSSARSIRKRARASNPVSAFSGKKIMLDVVGKKPSKLSKPKAGGKGGGAVGEILSDCSSFRFDYLACIIILDERCAFTKVATYGTVLHS
jgi:hypothetical protein